MGLHRPDTKEWTSILLELARCCIFPSVRYLQFSVRVGSPSTTGPCPRPDSSGEAIDVQVTCDGGIAWQSLKRIEVEDDTFREPM